MREQQRVAPESIRLLTPAVRALLWIAGTLVFLAGVQLFVFSERTEDLFAWTIDVPLTAAFLGAGYWASVAFEWLAAREQAWANARVALPSVFLFTTLTLVTTLIHLDLFHLDGSFSSSARAAAWGWLAIYTAVPIALAIVLTLQMRAPGTDPPRSVPLPTGLRALLTIQAALMLSIGLYLFVWPEQAVSLWAWPLTPLTGRAVGAWVLSIGLTAAHVLLENDARRARVAAVAYVALGLLQLVALGRYLDTVAWGEVQASVYLLSVVSMPITGLALLRLQWKAGG